MTTPTYPSAALAATLLTVALVAGNAQAQSTGARLTEVQGIVLVSQSDAIVAALGGERLPVGSRVVTTAGASATISDDAGCDVLLSENQRFTVRTGPCPVLLAQVQTQGPAPGAIGGGTAGAPGGTGTEGGPGTAGFIAAGVIVGIGLYEQGFKKKKISPN